MLEEVDEDYSSRPFQWLKPDLVPPPAETPGGVGWDGMGGRGGGGRRVRRRKARGRRARGLGSRSNRLSLLLIFERRECPSFPRRGGGDQDAAEAFLD